MKIETAAFDAEISKILPDDFSGDIFAHSPLGIACAGIDVSGAGYDVYHKVPLLPGCSMTKTQAHNLVAILKSLRNEGKLIVTWNGCSFDWRLLAEESDLHEECVELCLDHCDLMLLATFQKGWKVKLDSALIAHKLKRKIKIVKLNDGTVINDMDGGMAPILWARGEYDAVMTYLRRDCESVTDLTADVITKKQLRFMSSTGNFHSVPVDRLLTVRQALMLPKPDTSWMTDPPTRESFTAWMKRE